MPNRIRACQRQAVLFPAPYVWLAARTEKNPVANLTFVKFSTFFAIYNVLKNYF